MSEDRTACEKQALGLLARREHSRKELERKLARRRYGAQTIADVLDELEQSGALALSRFAESLVHNRVAKGRGPVRIRAELAEHDIDPADCEALFAAHDWRALAREVRLKRFGRAVPRDFGARARQMRFLQYRGFELEQINAALDADEDSD